MSKLEELRLATDYSQFRQSYNGAISMLPPDIRRTLTDIFKSYLARFGLDGAFEMMRGRTIAQIISEFRPAELRPIVSGEVDGVRYELFEPPEKTSPVDGG